MLPASGKKISKDDARFVGQSVRKAFKDGTFDGTVAAHVPPVEADQSDEKWALEYSNGKQEAVAPQEGSHRHQPPPQRRSRPRRSHAFFCSFIFFLKCGSCPFVPPPPLLPPPMPMLLLPPRFQGGGWQRGLAIAFRRARKKYWRLRHSLRGFLSSH